MGKNREPPPGHRRSPAITVLQTIQVFSDYYSNITGVLKFIITFYYKLLSSIKPSEKGHYVSIDHITGHVDQLHEYVGQPGTGPLRSAEWPTRVW